MTDLAAEFAALAAYRPRHRVRFVTAAALFDGHDAAINIMRRLLIDRGVEVIHLGHDRSVDEVVDAALQEDVQGIAISSYQGGHLEYFRYAVDRLRERGGGHVRVFGGGGGVIVPAEIGELQRHGVERIYSPEDGQRMGLAGMVGEMVMRCDIDLSSGDAAALPSLDALAGHGDAAWRALARLVTAIENGHADAALKEALHARAQARTPRAPVVGVTGTGGAGKSSLTDELIRRLRVDQDDALRIAVLSVDPSRRKSGGALLGDRIRMNAIGPWRRGPRVWMRSLATRDANRELPAALPDAIAAAQAAGFDVVVVETPGIGQGSAAIVPLVDVPVYVMTPEFGAASQLEKIDMLDFAEFVAINKFDRRGAPDALRDVAKQVQRNRGAFGEAPDAMPVYGTIASRFDDDGTTALYHALKARLAAFGLTFAAGRLPPVAGRRSTRRAPVVPDARAGYLAAIAKTVRGHRRRAAEQSRIAREVQQLDAARGMLAEADADADAAVLGPRLDALAREREARLDAASRELLAAWPGRRNAYSGDEHVRTTLSGCAMPRVALPRDDQQSDHGALLRWLLLENLPGAFPYTAGAFAFRRETEEPTRMFAGEGDPARTNRRFRLLCAGMPARRLSTAFDSVTLYGRDPDLRPDVYGKIGNAGVSVATLDDMKALYAGFDLCDPATSVSMTINGPAPTILAMFIVAAIDQQIDAFRAASGRDPTEGEAAELRARALSEVRGTVQADILKEDQGQNTCLFSTEFSLKVMGDVAEYFVRHRVRHFYSASISGYHIAEAGANPVTQLAFTLANAFTYVEAYLARGMQVDAFAPNLSFFFSNGMDPEYAVLGRVARRIWAVAMRDFYRAGERSRQLKYHVQTSGRSLHAQEAAFNDIRTTLQALIAVYDNCNSLHTNAYDEAITTPTEESVRRALAIQLIIQREWGLAKNENPNQGSFVIDELTDQVEDAVLAEFERLSERGGVLGAMETGYQRGRIQDESLRYETLKHGGGLPIVGVNTFRDPGGDAPAKPVALARSTDAEKQGQLARLVEFQARHAAEAPAMLDRLRQTVIDGGNVFEVLIDAVRVCSLGQITDALFEVGGRYRRGM